MGAFGTSAGAPSQTTAPAVEDNKAPRNEKRAEPCQNDKEFQERRMHQKHGDVRDLKDECEELEARDPHGLDMEEENMKGA
jgi:hypothetical protein